MYDCSSSMYRLRTAVMSKQLVIYNILNEMNYSNPQVLYFQELHKGVWHITILTLAASTNLDPYHRGSSDASQWTLKLECIGC